MRIATQNFGATVLRRLTPQQEQHYIELCTADEAAAKARSDFEEAHMFSPKDEIDKILETEMDAAA